MSFRWCISCSIGLAPPAPAWRMGGCFGAAVAGNGGLNSGQSKRGSLVEAALNTFLGWFVAFLANLAILPWFGLPVTPGKAAGIGVAFAVVSLVRSYLLRRLFERFGKRHGKRKQGNSGGQSRA